jgi:hypothetical protein
MLNFAHKSPSVLGLKQKVIFFIFGKSKKLAKMWIFLQNYAALRFSTIFVFKIVLAKIFVSAIIVVIYVHFIAKSEKKKYCKIFATVRERKFSFPHYSVRTEHTVYDSGSFLDSDWPNRCRFQWWISGTSLPLLLRRQLSYRPYCLPETIFKKSKISEDGSILTLNILMLTTNSKKATYCNWKK